jgi:hypothetical protein
MTCSRLTITAFWMLTLSVTAQSTVPIAADASRRTEVLLPRVDPTVETHNDLSRRSIEEETSFAPQSPGDSDIGDQLILKQVPKNEPFRFTADSFLFYTDNAAHTSAGELSDTFYGGRVAATYQPRLSNKLFASVGVSEDLFRYNEYDALNFESFETNATLLYALPKLADSLLFIGYSFNRITQDFEPLLTSHSARAGIQKTVLFNRRNSLALSIMGDWDIDTDIDAIKRHEYSGSASYKFKLMTDISLGLSYRYTYFDYTEYDRHDDLHSIGFGITYTPWEWCEIYLSATYAFNTSNFDIYDYEAANLGGGLGVRIKF